jgi:3-methylcrotonyl-CoA carboxylase alpha subunit
MYHEPSGDGIRVDSGVAEGQTVSVHYDPLLAKLICHGQSREVAMQRMIAAIAEYDILGLRHNLSFLLALLRRNEVREGRAHTGFIEEHLTELAAPPSDETLNAAAALAAWAADREAQPQPVAGDDDLAAMDPWNLLGTIVW